MELDKALEFAVVLGWDDLKKATDPCSARVEYRSAVGTAVDYLSIWSVDGEGNQQYGVRLLDVDFLGPPQWDMFQRQIPFSSVGPGP